MAHPALYAPWRMDYIRSLHKDGEEACFVCQAAAAQDPAQQKQRLVLWHTPHTVVLMNRYPYTNGHLLIAPRAHKPELEELSQDEKLDLIEQTAEAVRLLKRAVSAQGFNIGTNIGRCAGAGLPGHLHQHVVPRWGGDVNFMSVVGEVQVVPEAISQLYRELIDVRGKMMSVWAPMHLTVPPANNLPAAAIIRANESGVARPAGGTAPADVSLPS